MSKSLTLSEAVERSYSIHQCAAGANVTRFQIEAWVTRGFLKPEHKPAPPEPRKYSYREVFHIAVFAEMVRLGIPSANCVSNVTFLPGASVKPGYLAFWQGPVELVGAIDRRTGKPIGGKPVKWYDPDNPGSRVRIIRKSEIGPMADDPDVRSLVLINLENVETRVLTALAETDAI